MSKANAGPDTNVCAGESIMLFGSATNKDSILWTSDGDGYFDDDTVFTPVYTPGSEDIAKGYAWIRLTSYDSSPCDNSNTDKMKLTIDQCTGISEGITDDFSLQVIPNPATTQLNFNVTGAGKQASLVITLTNLQGEKLFTIRTAAMNGNYSNSMDVSRFPKGVYFMNAVTGNKQATQKIILQ
jgi:hypothetical protein